VNNLPSPHGRGAEGEVRSVNVLYEHLTFEPLASARWDDFERLFGPNGACSGCWCMFLHQTQAEFSRLHGASNKAAMRARVESGATPGLIAYAGDAPVGWCAVAPRDEYATVARSRILKPVDDAPAWAIVCFYVPRAHRGRGITGALVVAARDYAHAHGAQVVEGYPVDPGNRRIDSAAAWHGTASIFRAAGFAEVARRSPTRPIMRWRGAVRAADEAAVT
jgi:GNAT superfamily N-acetyltransferase